MARGTQFSQLVSMLRAELRRSTNVAVGVDDLPMLKQAINRQYEIQAHRHDWPFLCGYYSLPLATSQKFYQLPSGLSDRRIKDVAVFFSGEPQRLERGIDFADYALYDFDQGQLSDPVLKWDIRFGSASQPQVEVWPVPSSNTQVLKFFGYHGTPSLVNDSDLCLIDDFLVVLYAAAGCLSLDLSEPRTGLPPAAQLKLTEAENYFNNLIRDQARGAQMIAIGQGRMARGVDTNSLVRVRG